METTMTEPKTEQAEPQAPICATQKCKRPLTRLGPPQNCWRCLVCNPRAKTSPTMVKKNKYIDVTLTEEMVREIIKEERTALGEMTTPFGEDQIREIVQDELANWHIQKSPVTRDEITEAVGSVDTEPVHVKVDMPTGIRMRKVDLGEPALQPAKEPTWRQRAKNLGVPLHKEPPGSGMRKKEDVLADMERLGEPP